MLTTEIWSRRIDSLQIALINFSFLFIFCKKFRYKKGRSRCEKTNLILKEIHREISEKNLYLEVFWCPSAQQQADAISRLELGALVPDHWPRLSPYGVDKLHKKMKPDVHVFGWPTDPRSIAAKYSSLQGV